MTAQEYQAKKDAKKAVQRIKSETRELDTLVHKYSPRPFPFTRDNIKPLDENDTRPMLSISQATRLQLLKLEYHYKGLREMGKTHDEAEKEVFPEAYTYRKEQEAKAKAILTPKKTRTKVTQKENE